MASEHRRRRLLLGLLRGFRRLGFEQKAAAAGAVLLIVSTFGPFSFVEAAQVLVALSVLALLAARADGRRFHLPFGDGTVIAGGACWAALLILVRLFDRSLGQNLLALGCTAILGVAGLAERQRRPPDDLPAERGTDREKPEPAQHEDPTQALRPEDAPTERLSQSDEPAAR